jgi:hypothetical protein
MRRTGPVVSVLVKLPEGVDLRRSSKAGKTLHGFARKPVFQQSPNWYLTGIVIILFQAMIEVPIGTICPANTRPQFMPPED